MTATQTLPQALTSLAAAEYPGAVQRGALVVDIRSRTQRERQGVLAGSIAIEARPAVEFLDPGSDVCLAAVNGAPEVLLVSDDGLDAELFSLELRGRGVRGVRAVDGGFDAVRRIGALGLLTEAHHLRRERSAISAH